MDAAQQLAEIKARSNTTVNTSIRQVQGGFVVTGQTQYAERETGAILAATNAEGVASTPEQAAQMTLNYHRGSTFDAAQPQLGLGINQGQQQQAPATI